MKKRTFGYLAGSALLGVALILFLPNRSPDRETPEVAESSLVVADEEVVVVEATVEPPEIEEKSEEVLDGVAVDERLVAAQHPAPDQLLLLIPEWLRTEGRVRRERIQVAGCWVERARSRYEWSNGSQVEVEITDLGEAASVDLLKSLGFNPEIEIRESERALRQAMDSERYLSNFEYDQEACEGFMQYVIDDRYLLEVQLQNLPLESFQVFEEQHGVFRSLLELPK